MDLYTARVPYALARETLADWELHSINHFPLFVEAEIYADFCIPALRRLYAGRRIKNRRMSSLTFSIMAGGYPHTSDKYQSRVATWA